MPREANQNPVTTITSDGGFTAITASAARMTGRKGKPDKAPKKASGWSADAWKFYDLIGEYRYAVSWVGNLLSRATLSVHENGKETKNQHALAALTSLFGGIDGQREMLRQIGLHLTVPGECYVIGEDMGDKPDKWQIVAADQLKLTGGTWKIDKEDLSDPLVIRIWRPHPHNSKEADSPSRAVLGVLAEIHGMTQHVAAQIASRLAGSGFLTIPSEMTFGSLTSGPDGQQVKNEASLDAFLLEVMETISLAKSNPSDPESLAPILLQGPGEHLDKIRQVTLWSPLDEKAKEMRDEAIRRLALGMDMPPETLTGSGDMNHWNAWQMEEASIKAHTEPLLQTIMNALTEQYLRPYLEESAGLDEDGARAFTFVADTSKIRLRPNRSKEAVELYDRGQLSAEAMLRENGFDPADAMDEKELSVWLTRKVAQGSTTPELVAAALGILGVAVPVEQLRVQETPTEERPTPSLLQHPENAIPDVTEVQVAEANIIVFRALERAGARIRSKHAASLVAGGGSRNETLYRHAELSTEQIEDVLMGAWECIDAMGLSVSPRVLDGYVRDLIRTGNEHTKDRLRAALVEAAAS